MSAGTRSSSLSATKSFVIPPTFGLKADPDAVVGGNTVKLVGQWNGQAFKRRDHEKEGCSGVFQQ